MAGWMAGRDGGTSLTPLTSDDSWQLAASSLQQSGRLVKLSNGRIVGTRETAKRRNGEPGTGGQGHGEGVGRGAFDETSG